MPENPEFEEKEFESPLYSELQQTSPHLWTPGQVIEGNLGIDAALNALANPVWEAIGVNRPIPGISLRDNSLIVAYKNLAVDPSRVPDFTVNLFVQAKRPEIMQYRTRGLASTNLTTPYWRFSIKDDQQSYLIEIHDAIGDNGAVVYSSPAFDTMNELTRFTLNERIAENSTYVPAIELENHHYWAYDNSGGIGYRCSEPEIFEGEPLYNLVESLSEKFATNNESQKASECIKSLDKLHKRIMDNVVTNNDITQPRIQAFNQMRTYIEPITEEYNLTSFIELNILFRILGIEWFVVG